MSDLVTPGEVDAEIDSTSTGHALAKAGTGGWVVNGVDLAGNYTSLDETGVNSFAISSTSGLDVTFDGGEAYVAGWLCRDRQTTVTLPDDSTTTVYVGYDAGSVLSSGTAPADNDNVIIGPSGDFASEDPQYPVWEIVTSGGSVSDSTRVQPTRKPMEYDPTVPSFDFAGQVLGERTLRLSDPQGDYGNVYMHNSREFDNTMGHYVTTTTPHLPFIIRNNATNTLVADNGDIDVPVGHIYYQGDATLRVTQDWNGDSMVLESSNGDTIELVRE
ncbi:hypothetical protein [Natrialba taiwanensis]|uniref:Uncharacterized protein n=1 Tax=Natrialba taiwanensis DSM 12281 TaxID=1230458 RepID=L9ZZI3_9EURY|nr:hypothetical protein [Natrialba taiwanensis]ELY91481.1 hypothetical protein C484_10651 [Natrialba taiwanensis DSM 12281]